MSSKNRILFLLTLILVKLNTFTQTNYTFIVKHNSKFHLLKTDSNLNSISNCDTIFHVGSYHFAYKKNNDLYTLINEDLEEIESEINEVLTFEDYIFIKKNNQYKILSNNNYLNFKCDSLIKTKNFILMFHSNKQGIINIKPSYENEYIEPKYDKVGKYYNGYLLIDNKKLGWKNSKTEIPVKYNHIYKVRPNLMAAKNHLGIEYYRTDIDLKLLNLSSDSVVFYDYFYKIVRGNKQIIYNYENVYKNEVLDYELHPLENLSYKENSEYCIVNNNEKCALYNKNKFLTEFQYDNFLPQPSFIQENYFRIIENNQVGLIDENGEYILKPIYDFIASQKDDYFLIQKNGKFGLVTYNDEIILKPEYTYISINNNHAIVNKTKNEKSFGVIDLKNSQMVTEFKYINFTINNNLIIGHIDKQNRDVYFNKSKILSNIKDINYSEKVVKGYSNQKIYIAYLDSIDYEISTYDIPSYYIGDNNKYSGNGIRISSIIDIDYLYEYKSGKWGIYSFNEKKWSLSPLKHSGDLISFRYLNYENDSILQWEGLQFQSIKKLKHINNSNNYLHWLDNLSYGYSTSEKNDISKSNNIEYSQIDNGTYGSTLSNINEGYGNHQYDNNLISPYKIISYGGITSIYDEGDITLSDFITKKMLQGTNHPLNIEDYEIIISPLNFVKTKYSKEKVMQIKPYGVRSWVKMEKDFNWVNKDLTFPLIYRDYLSYGALNDTGGTVLHPVFDTIYTLKNLLVAGKNSKQYKLFNPSTKKIEKIFYNVDDINENYILVQTSDYKYNIFNPDLKMIHTSNNKLEILGGEIYVEIGDENSTVYQNQKELFSHNLKNTERINDNYFKIYSDNQFIVVNHKKDTLYNSKEDVKIIKWHDLFILDEYSSKKVFNSKGNFLYDMGSYKYFLIDNGNIIVDQISKTVVIDSKKAHPYDGEIIDFSPNFFSLKSSKKQSIYDQNGKLIYNKCDRIVKIDDEFVAYKRKGKIFILNVLNQSEIETNSFEIEKQFSSIIYFDMNNEKQMITIQKPIKNKDGYEITFDLRYGLKKGDVYILPEKYLNIKPFGYNYLIQDKMNYWLYDFEFNSSIVNDYFDQIFSYKNLYVGIKNGEYHYMDTNGFIELSNVNNEIK